MRQPRPPSSRRAISRRNQQGVTLLFGMLFLLTIALLALGGVAMSRYQQRLALAMNDHEVAFQSATLALRAAELRVETLRSNGLPDTANQTNGDDNCLQPTGIDPCETTAPGKFPKNGICPSATQDNYYAASDEPWVDKNAQPQPLQGLELQTSNEVKPKFVIEIVTDPLNNSLPTSLYRITASGWGRFPATVVRLQEIYRCATRSP